MAPAYHGTPLDTAQTFESSRRWGDTQVMASDAKCGGSVVAGNIKHRREKRDRVRGHVRTSDTRKRIGRVSVLPIGIRSTVTERDQDNGPGCLYLWSMCRNRAFDPVQNGCRGLGDGCSERMENKAGVEDVHVRQD